MFSIDRFVDILVSIDAQQSLSLINASKFRELISEEQYQQCKMEVNLFCIALELGIVKNIAESSCYDYSMYVSNVSLLERDYGISKGNAQALVISICQACKIDLRFLMSKEIIDQDIVFSEEIEKYFSSALAAAADHQPIPLGHTLYITTNIAKRKAFVERFIQTVESCYQSAYIKEMPLSRSMRDGDLAATLTNASGDMSLFYTNELTIDLGQGGLQAMYRILSEGNIAIMIGKGPMARSIVVDIPPCLILTCAASTSKSLVDLMPAYHHVFKDE